MSTTIITDITQIDQNSENVNTNVQIDSSAVQQSDAIISVFNPVTHGIGKTKFTDYEIKVKVIFINVKHCRVRVLVLSKLYTLILTSLLIFFKFLNLSF